MALKIYEGSLPHIYWIDLAGNGMMHECAVMKKTHRNTMRITWAVLLLAIVLPPQVALGESLHPV